MKFSGGGLAGGCELEVVDCSLLILLLELFTALARQTSR